MYALTEEQVALRNAVRSLLSRRSDPAAVRAAAASGRGYDPDLWSVLCEQIGVAALAVPEEYGGAGAGVPEIRLVLEELGRTLTPSPLLGSAVLAAQALLASGDAEACKRLLPGIADGSRIATVLWTGPAGHWSAEDTACSAEPRGTGGWALHGRAHHVLDGDLADVLLVAARTDTGIGLFEVTPHQPGVHRRHAATMDLTRRLATVRLAGATGRRIGDDARPALRRARDTACAALSGEQVGAASRCLELTVEYAKARVQFDRPIGSFQALKHRMADMYVLVETARSASHAAAQAAEEGDAELLAARAAAAKTYCSEALCRVAAEMIQLHGGIAITWEHDAHLYFKRAHGSAQLFGQPREHAARLGRLLGLDGPARSGGSLG
ncbi:acyl-CoA dehydrogenase family protein [Gandjariella thermophila]|uniref:acyl-CoA dehydrogenase family protein n=1 Tax=Gandjariella thermophila TaxID=1931992 RepID=UPI0010F9DCF7|nr:acyl-CoA dehydrogenase family protein [Gandjariella thermophila]